MLSVQHPVSSVYSPDLRSNVPVSISCFHFPISSVLYSVSSFQSQRPMPSVLHTLSIFKSPVLRSSIHKSIVKSSVSSLQALVSNVQYLSNVECLILSVSCLVILVQCPVSYLPVKFLVYSFHFQVFGVQSQIQCLILITWLLGFGPKFQPSSKVPDASPQVPDFICLVSPQISISYSNVFSEILLIVSEIHFI